MNDHPKKIQVLFNLLIKFTGIPNVFTNLTQKVSVKRCCDKCHLYEHKHNNNTVKTNNMFHTDLLISVK